MNRLQTLPAQAPAPTRQRELEVGRLVERAVRARLDGDAGARFLGRRAAADVAALEASGARQALSRALAGLEQDDGGRELCGAMVSYGGVLERHRQRDEAVEAFETALAVHPGDPELMLHLARSHRKAGNTAAALDLYRQVRECGDARLSRFSALGEALLAERAEEALTAVREEAAASGDLEVAAVALEERARVRRRQSRWGDAVDDLLHSARAYEDRRDRLRIAHALADLLLACGDLPGAREALMAALSLSFADERDHAVQRLRSIARAQGDEVGLRRWPPAGRAPLVSLMPSRRRPDGSFARAVQRWRDELGDDPTAPRDA